MASRGNNLQSWSKIVGKYHTWSESTNDNVSLSSKLAGFCLTEHPSLPPPPQPMLLLMALMSGELFRANHVRGSWGGDSVLTAAQNVLEGSFLYILNRSPPNKYSCTALTLDSIIWCELIRCLQMICSHAPKLWIFVSFVQVSEVRRSTRLEKKKLAMAMREKQLGALGMEVCSFRLLAMP